jgi:hypothetical protein
MESVLRHEFQASRRLGTEHYRIASAIDVGALIHDLNKRNPWAFRCWALYVTGTFDGSTCLEPGHRGMTRAEVLRIVQERAAKRDWPSPPYRAPFKWNFSRVRRLIGFARAFIKERLIMADLRS